MAAQGQTMELLVEVEPGAMLVLLVRERDPGVVHVFGRNIEAGVVRGMTIDESALVGHPAADEAVDALAGRAITAWTAWADVDRLVIVHNVVGSPEHVAGEA